MGNLVICTPFFSCHLSQPVYDTNKLGSCFFHQRSIIENDYQASTRSIEQQEWNDCTTPVDDDESAKALSPRVAAKSISFVIQGLPLELMI